MTRKYKNHTLQTNPRHLAEELHNSNSHKRMNVKQHALLPQQYDCTTRKNTKLHSKTRAKHKNGTTIKMVYAQVTHSRTGRRISHGCAFVTIRIGP